MSRLDNIECLVEKLRVTTTAAMDERILSNAFAALEKSIRTERAGLRTSLWKSIVKSRIAKLAVAAVIIVAVLIGAELFITSGKQPTPPKISVLQTEKKRIETMAVAGDVDGLVTMLSKGQFVSKVFAAKYLGKIGNERALPELEKLYLAAEVKLPEGYVENPFAEPIEKIKGRVEPKPGEGITVPDANETGVVDVAEGVLAEANEPAETNEPVETNEPADTNETEVAAVNVPAETPAVMDFYWFIKRPESPCRAFTLISKSRGKDRMM